MSTTDATSVAVPAAPLDGWRRLLGDSLLMGRATVINQVVGTATSLMLRIMIDPSRMGIWQGLKLILSYSNYANLGVSKGAARELSLAMGRGETAAATRSLDVAFTVNTLVSALAALGLIVAAALAAMQQGEWSTTWSAGLAAIAALVIIQRIVTYQVSLLRARRLFSVAARLSLLESTLTFVACGCTVWMWGLPGLYASTAVVLVASLLYLRPHAMRLRLDWDRKEFFRLVSIGGPVLLAGIFSSLLRSLDKLMILGYMPDREYQLGCYSIALLVSAQLYGLGNMLAVVSGPRYTELFSRTDSYKTVANVAARAAEIHGAVVGMAGGAAALLAPLVLAVVLPDYRAGLAPLVLLVPGTVALTMALPSSQFLLAVNRGHRSLVAAAVAVLAAAIGNHIALTSGWGLSGIAMATSAAYMLYFATVTALALWSELDARARIRYCLTSWLLLTPVVMASAVGYRAAQGPRVAGTVTSLALLIVAWGVLVYAAWRWGGWREAWRSSPHEPSADERNG